METRHIAGPAGELHALPMPTEGDTAELWIMQPTAPALIMGSSQKPHLFDHELLAADGVELAGRRSGGGAVFIEPGATVWVDLLAPRSSRWWSQELTENFLIIGRVWQRALASLGIDTDLCVESSERTDDAALACWAGVGWGELTIDGQDGRQAKVVGLSQRRTRWGCRVQAMAVLDGSSSRVSDYLVTENRPDIAKVTLEVTPAQLQAAVVASF